MHAKLLLANFIEVIFPFHNPLVFKVICHFSVIKHDKIVKNLHLCMNNMVNLN